MGKRGSLYQKRDRELSRDPGGEKMKNPHEYKDESSTLFLIARNLAEEARR